MVSSTRDLAFGAGLVMTRIDGSDEYKILGAVQNVSVNMAADTKTVHDSGTLAIGAGRGAVEITGSFEVAERNSGIIDLWQNPNQISGMDVVDDVASVAALSVVLPQEDITQVIRIVGVRDGKDFKQVASNPTAGQFSFDVDTSTLTFNTADVNTPIIVKIMRHIESGVTSYITSELMGTQPYFELKMFSKYNGKYYGFHLYKCVLTSLNEEYVNDDFSKPQADFTAFANDAGVAGTKFFGGTV